MIFGYFRRSKYPTVDDLKLLRSFYDQADDRGRWPQEDEDVPFLNRMRKMGYIRPTYVQVEMSMVPGAELTDKARDVLEIESKGGATS